jgi:signal transduction histidine kinase
VWHCARRARGGRTALVQQMSRIIQLLWSRVERAAIFCGGLLLVTIGFAYGSPEPQKSVLVLYGERGDLPAIQAIEENLREVFHAATAPQIDLYSEYLDFTRFPAQQYEASLVRYLQERYTGRRIDLVIPVIWSALKFALAHREELFRGAPMVFCAIDERELYEARLPPDVTGIAADFDFERTIGLIMQLQPDDAGVVGGAMVDFAANGRRTAELALKALRGQWVQYGTPETQSSNPLMINWMALRKAGLPEWRIPRDAQVQFRPPAFWETHRTFILIVLGAITFQGALIAVLVVERVWRRRAEAARNKAEAEARRYDEEVAHLSRVEILGEMAGSLAHELNQPLTGIMNNASAGRRFIAKGRADMQRLDGLFKFVVADARRAGEIIRGIRSMVHKGGGERAPVNLNHIIADVVTFTRSDALERHCTVVVEPDPNLPMVKANRVQLQQVLLNITLNAFDSMRQLPVAQRRVIIRSTSRSDGGVQVSVRDFGTGLPAENPQRIFDQFFSTKRDGLGMGLAIARSIIASHGGELAAENAGGGGAFLYFSLPAIAEVVA